MSEQNTNVGYKNPPISTQFKPGESGNPKGRPKGVKNLATDLQEELEQKVTVTEGNETSQVTKQRAMLKTLFAKAMKGDVRASNALITLILGLEETRKSVGEPEILSEEDQAVLDSYRKRILEQITPKVMENDDE